MRTPVKTTLEVALDQDHIPSTPLLFRVRLQFVDYSQGGEYSCVLPRRYVGRWCLWTHMRYISDTEKMKFYLTLLTFQRNLCAHGFLPHNVLCWLVGCRLITTDQPGSRVLKRRVDLTVVVVGSVYDYSLGCIRSEVR